MHNITVPIITSYPFVYSKNNIINYVPRKQVFLQFKTLNYSAVCLISSAKTTIFLINIL